MHLPRANLKIERDRRKKYQLEEVEKVMKLKASDIGRVSGSLNGHWGQVA